MKPLLAGIFFAVALSFIAAGAQATDSMSVEGGASSVANMLQRKHEAELRAQLVTAGRWDEIRKLDDATAQQLQVQREKRYQNVNEQLSHSTGVEGELIDARGLDCDSDATHVR
jgi:hypothetical protein